MHTPTEAELTTLRCPSPAGCRFRVRPTNIDGWHEWSLGSEPVTTPFLPPASTHALRLELRLIAPFTQDTALLEDVLLRDLAKALRVPQGALSLVEVRLAAEFVTIDVLPPDAFATASRLHRLIHTPTSTLHDGQASRSIDATYGVALIHRNGQSEPFSPDDERSFPAFESVFEAAEAGLEHTLGVSPRSDAFWQAAATVSVVLLVLFGCCCAGLRRTLSGPPKYRYSRTLATDDPYDPYDEMAAEWAYANGRYEVEDDDGEDADEEDVALHAKFRVSGPPVEHMGDAALPLGIGSSGSALASLQQATAMVNGTAASSAVDELRRAASAAGVVTPLAAPPPPPQQVDWSAAVSSAASRLILNQNSHAQGKKDEQILHL